MGEKNVGEKKAISEYPFNFRCSRSSGRHYETSAPAVIEEVRSRSPAVE